MGFGMESENLTRAGQGRQAGGRQVAVDKFSEGQNVLLFQVEAVEATVKYHRFRAWISSM